MSRNALPWSTMSDEARKQYWASLALRYAKGIGQRTRAQLLNAYGSAYAAVQNLPHWKDVGISAEKGAKVADGSWRELARIEWEDAQNLDAHIVMWHEDDFPLRLKELSDAPILLYLKGDVSLLKSPALGIVGARKCTKDGLRIASRFAREISDCGLTVVSGMAYGVDKVAHTHALQGIGKSIGVLGTGIDIMYPEANIKTYENMLESGLLVSEFPPHTFPNAINFPIRNRIISGLSLGILVIEASLRSGSLITARQALEQNREVYAVPGTMFSASASGCQELIRQGARAVFCVEDIIRDLEMQLIPYNISTSFENNSEQINLNASASSCASELFDEASTLKGNENNSQENSTQANKVQNNKTQANNSQANKVQENSARSSCAKDNSTQENSDNKEFFGDENKILDAYSGKNKPNFSKEAQFLAANKVGKRPLPEGEAGLVVKFLASKKSCHIDELSIAMNKPVSELNALLIKLEIEDWVSRSAGARYSIIR